MLARIIVFFCLLIFSQNLIGQISGSRDGMHAVKNSENALAARDAFFHQARQGADLLSAEEFWMTHLTAAKTSASGNWKSIGPEVVPSHFFFGRGGNGRVNVIRQTPGNPQSVWIGSPSGGLWHSTNGGMNWTANNDHLNVLGISDLAFDPVQNSTLYLATGDADGNGGKTYSIGILKSTDSGNSWNLTGLNWPVSQKSYVSNVLVNPTQSNVLLAATSEGIYRSIDGAGNWTLVRAGNWRDITFQPGNALILYASGSTFIRSTDGGLNWTQTLSAAVPAGRIAIATSAAEANLVDILIANNSNSGFYAHYRSLDAGQSWNYRSSSPNILSGSDDGSTAGGLGAYALVFASSPTDTSHLIAGSINLWESHDGGANWTLLTYWENFSGSGNGRPLIHADQHCLFFEAGNDSIIWAGNDGGIFKSMDGGVTWQDLSDGLSITQLYRLGLSPSDTNRVLAGTQDNGTLRVENGNWEQLFLGDGMECLEDPANSATVYFSFFSGALAKSVNNGASYSLINGSISETGGWVTPFVMHPQNSQELLAGYDNIWRTADGGGSWTAVSNFNSTGKLKAVRYSPGNPNQVWAAVSTSEIFLSTNGGNTWSDISTTVPGSGHVFSDIGISGGNLPEIWVSCAGYQAGEKVFRTADWGQTWINMSGSLPNLPVNTLVQDSLRLEGWYVGMDIGVYAYDAALADWVNHSDDLPNVIVHELEVRYASGEIVAATYGRGLWASDLYRGVQISIEKPLQEPLFVLGPNPADTELKLRKTRTLEMDIVVEIRTLEGKIVASHFFQANADEIRLDIAGWTGGLYLVAFHINGREAITLPLIVK